MEDILRKGQRWVLDAFIASGGVDVLHPESVPAFIQLGYDFTDLKRVFDRVKATSMVTSAWSMAAKEIEQRAAHYDARGFRSTARRLYERATLLYGRAHYSILGNDERRRNYLRRCVGCFEKVAAMSDHKVERVAIPFEGGHIYGIFEASRDAIRQPCVIVLPGMDMFKEDWHCCLANRVLPRGWCGFALDGPGQGETLTHGVKMTLDNYERAVTAVIDWLQAKQEVDADRVCLMGSSMGSWWGVRAAGTDRRLKAAAVNMTALGDKGMLLNYSQPNFIANLMFMTGIRDPQKMQEFALAMGLDELARAITIPFLVVAGENDELTTLEDTLGIYEQFAGPKELWTFQHEFHPIGPQSDEWLNASLDWLEQALQGQFDGKYAKQYFITKAGDYQDGSGTPPWWTP